MSPLMGYSKYTEFHELYAHGDVGNTRYSEYINKSTKRDHLKRKRQRLEAEAAQRQEQDANATDCPGSSEIPTSDCDTQ